MTEPLTIPGYRIESRLGQGGMATVYLAIQESFEREVALKVMSPVLNSDPSFAERFKREARIVAQLNHASIVPVFDVGEHQSHHYLSMEYLPGGDLKRRVVDGEGDLNLALKVCMALGAALETAHRKRFVHRDIKPENILFREDGTPVLTDFGIARALDSVRSMTVAGMLVGTPDYMSPEQVKGLELDGRSDLYSVGVVFYEVLTGSVPFKAESTLSVALKQVGEALPPLPPEYAEYQEFLDCLTAKDRELRFASGGEVVRALRLVSSGKSTRDRTLIRTLTPVQGLAGPSTRVTPSPKNSTPMPAEMHVLEPTLYRPRAGSESPSAPDLEHAQRESPDVSNLSSPANPDGAVIAKHEASAETDGGIGAADTQLSAIVPAAMTAIAPSSVELVAKTSVSADSLASDSTTDAVRSLPTWLAAAGRAAVTLWQRARYSGNRPPWLAAAGRTAVMLWQRARDIRGRPLWLAAAGVAALAMCVGLVFIARPHKDIRASAATQSQLNTQPASAPAANPLPPTAQATPTAQPTAAPTPQDAPAEQATADEIAPAAPSVESGQAESATADSATTAEARAQARAEAKARRNREWEEYLKRKAERKAEKERLAAEAHAAELAAQEMQIQGLISAAKAHYAAGALWQPAGSSAADSYRAILKMQPQRPEALAGAAHLANVLADEAEAAEASGDLDSSRQLIDEVQSLQPTQPKLPGLQARLQQLESSPAALDARDRGRLDRAAKNIVRAQEDLGHQPLDFKAVDDATDQYDKALAAAPKAPGLPSLKERLIVAYAIAIQTALDLHDTKRAQKLITNAHKRNWSSPELDQLETTLQGGSATTAGIKEAGTH